MIYLDNAATSFPKPGSVLEAMCDQLCTAAGNPGRSGHTMSVRAAQRVWQARVAIARLIGAKEPRRIAFALNGTDALNLAIKGWLRPGDHVVTTAMEHNSVLRPLAALEAGGIRHARVPCDARGQVDPDDVVRALERSTRMVIVNHASNVVGTIQAVREIGTAVRARGLVLLVDAAQSVGRVDIDVERDCIDLLAFPGHKSLFGPTGTGALWVGERVRLTALRQGGTGTHSQSEQQPTEMPEALESGTLNTVGIAGLRAGVEFVLHTGVETIAARERELGSRLVSGLQAIDGVTVHGAGAESVACLSLTVRRWEPSDLAAALDASSGIAVRAGLHCAPAAHRAIGTFPAGTVRLSPGWFNTREQIEQAIDAIGALARS